MIACHMTDFKFLDTNIEHHFIKNKKEFHGLAANAHTCICEEKYKYDLFKNYRKSRKYEVK